MATVDLHDRSALPPPFLAEAPEPIREQLAAAVELPEFLRGAGTLTLDERVLLVEQAMVLLEQNYVHLPLKVAMHAVNPVQRLRLLRTRLQRADPGAMEPEWLFHAELSSIFHSVRDLHTNYLLPAPFAGMIAFLPFQVEEFFADGEARFVVARMVAGFTAPGFGPGAEVTHWSGIPVGRAVELNATRFAGSNAAARRSRGIESLTLRPLRIHLPPDEEWVTVSYLGLDGVARELREKWLVTQNLPALIPDPDEATTTSFSLGLDLDADEVGRAKKLLFAPAVLAQELAGDMTARTPEQMAGQEVVSSMPGVFRARDVVTSSGTFAHLRIFTFSVDDPDAFVAEFVRLLGLLPQNGLVLDVRGNGGGHIFASEFALQTLTPRRIVPEPVQFLSTPMNLRIVNRHRLNPTNQIDLGPWHASLDQATETGATFSGAFPITPEAGANAIGQTYHGPVVLVTDARCYSATDIFAAGFQDHRIGTVLGVDDNTGAGGANVWTHGLLKTLMEIPTADPGSPYRELPKGANMRVSIRRTLRVGAAPGTPLEDLGVVPDQRHRLTRRDVIDGNLDLLDRAGQILAAQPVHRLAVQVGTGAGGTLTLEVEVSEADRLDVYVDDRPRSSVDVSAGQTDVTVPGITAGAVVRVEAFAGGELVAARTLAA